MQVEPMFLVPGIWNAQEIQYETGGLWHPLVRALRLLWPGGWMLERWSKSQQSSRILTASRSMSQVQITSRWSAHPDHHRSPDPWPYRTNPYCLARMKPRLDVLAGDFHRIWDASVSFRPVADRRFIQPVWTSNTSQMRGQSWHWGRPVPSGNLT